MQGKSHTVYARCYSNKGIFLFVEYQGSRSQCTTYIRTLARQGRATHFLFVSKLGMEAAKRRYLP